MYSNRRDDSVCVGWWGGGGDPVEVTESGSKISQNVMMAFCPTLFFFVVFF